MKPINSLKPLKTHRLPANNVARPRIWTLFAAFICMIVAPLIRATPVTVPDFSFESAGVAGPGQSVGPDNGLMLGTAPNWDISGNSGEGVQSITNGDTFFNAATLPAPADGTNYLFEHMLNAASQNFASYCWQDIGALQPNTAYTLTIAVGQTLDGETGQGIIALVNGQSPFQTILASTPVDNSTYTPGTFSNVTVVYTTGEVVSGDLTILMQGNSGQELDFDNVRLNAVAAANPSALLPILASAFTSNSVFTGTLMASPTNTVYVGNIVSLSENPAGTGPFTYQWLSDNGSGGATFTAVSGGTASTLSINTAGFTPGSTVEYKVAVTNGSGNSTSPAVSITAISGEPVVFVDTIPTTAGDNVGDNVIFTATFVGSSPMSFQWFFDNGSGPAPIHNATNETLSLTNVQLTDAGSYSLTASNSFAVVTDDPGVLSVSENSTNPSDGVITWTAYETGLGTNSVFTPTWILATNSLIAGESPSASTPSNNAFAFAGSGGVAVLTDGKAGTMPPAGNSSPTLAACGTGTSVGESINYAFPTNGAPYGWTITNITVYGGWADAGRMEQEYDLFYSTYASPTNFGNQINAGGSSGGYAGVDFQYPDPTGIDPNGVQCATRVTLTSTNGALVQNASGLELYFNILAKAVENGWDGYGEIQVFGTPSGPSVVIISNTSPAFAGDVEGSSVTFTTSFSAPGTLNYQWFVNTGGGAVSISGATSPNLTLANLQVSDTGSYSCLASNSSGFAMSSAASLTVNSAPGADAYNAIDNEAFQADSVPFFYPTWDLPAGDLLEGLAPSAVGPGQFDEESASGVNVLTDGSIGGIGGGNDIDTATCGPNAGQSVFYRLPTSGAEAGYTITNIQVFCGWSDHGRDENECLIYYSTPSSPNAFTNPMAVWDYLPPNVGAIPNMTRVSAVGSSGPLATNVAGIEVDFIGGENGYEGYSEIAAYGYATPGTVPVSPVISQDIIPFVGSDVVGSSATFSASFSSSAPLSYQWYSVTNGLVTPVSGGTSASLTLANLTASDSGSYFVIASNDLGEATSTTNSFTVNPAPTPSNGVIEAFAYQQTFSGGPELVPTWTLTAGDLLEGVAPTSTTGNFQQNGDGPISSLTDGQIGYVGGTVFSFCSCGNSPNGSVAIYPLPGSANGYNISQIVTYGGWQDAGRDWQNYTVSYATVEHPTTFIPLTSVLDKASLLDTNALPNMTRVTITPSGESSFAQNVVAVEFNFSTPSGQENGWQGYSELAVYGSVSPPPVAFNSFSISGGNFVLTGSGGTAGAAYTILSATNLLGPWVTNTSGTFGSTGSFTNAIPLSHSVAGQYFRFEIP
jgi:hypothetical protein